MNNKKQLGLVLALLISSVVADVVAEIAPETAASGISTSVARGPAGDSSRRDNKLETPMAAMEAKALDKQMRTMVEQASADLVERRGEKNVSPSDVEILYAERVTWRSSAMGCPMPDRGYKMVLTPGVRIVLRIAGKEYEYHGTRRGVPFLCEPPATIETPAPGKSSLDPT
ncbi:MAG: hypothetical protein AAF756_03980 [Pseudomonadota bacterium]